MTVSSEKNSDMQGFCRALAVRRLINHLKKSEQKHLKIAEGEGGMKAEVVFCGELPESYQPNCLWPNRHVCDCVFMSPSTSEMQVVLPV